MTAEKDMTAPEQPSANSIEAGTLLKQKREQLGLSQKQIADRLRLRVSIIESIENNQFSSELVSTFTKGYLRSYAKAVGIDESEVLAAYACSGNTEVEERPMQSFSRQTKKARHDSRIMTITWIIVLVIVGISSVWWWQNQQTTIVDLTESTDQQLELEQTNEHNDLAVIAPNVAPSNDVEKETSPASVMTETTAEKAAPVTQEKSDVAVQQSDVTAAPVEKEQPTVETQASIAANLLTMTFDGDCWIQVKDKSGKTVSVGVKKTGQTLELSGELPYKVILGAPENVSMTLASEPVDLSGYTSGKVARFTLP